MPTTCQHCGKEVSESAKVCRYCGTELSAPTMASSYGREPQGAAASGSMLFNQAQASIQQAGVAVQQRLQTPPSANSAWVYSDQLPMRMSEGEVIIKTYHCTVWKFPRGDGFLTITNKRVIYHGAGKSFTGRSRMLQEVNIDTVNGFSTFYGRGLNIYLFIAGILVSLSAIGSFLSLMKNLGEMVSYMMHDDTLLAVTAWLFPILSIVGLALIVVSNMQTDDQLDAAYIRGGLKSVGWLLVLFGAIAFLTFIGKIAYEALSSLSGSVVIVMLLAFLISTGLALLLFYLARGEAHYLLVNSSAQNAAITVVGFSRRNMIGQGTQFSLYAMPTPENEVMMQEVGAMVLDLKLMGDAAVAKYQQMGR